MKTRAWRALPALLLLGAATGPSAAPPKVASSSVETRPVGPGGLEAEVRAIARRQEGPAWAGYAVAVVGGRGWMCCFESLVRLKGPLPCCGRCRLEESDSFGISSADDDRIARLEGPESFLVVFRIAGGKVRKIRPFSEDCELDAGRLPFHWLTGVGSADSLAWLSSFVTGGGKDEESGEDLTEHALAAIAMHGDPAADRLLETFVAQDRPAVVREHAAFWIGVARGRAGYDILRRLVRDDPGVEMRKKALFALSQNPTPGSAETMIAVARGDRSAQVRAEAVFWLAQKAGQKAARAITESIDNDPDTEVKKKAVFALSQLPPDEGVPLLIDLARKHRNPQVRKEAIFWLGQSGDPRALDVIEEILAGAD